MISRSLLSRLVAVVASLLVHGSLAPASAQNTASSGRDSARTSEARRSPWYERMSVRGYTQVRYNRLLETNPDLTCPACDRSMGRGGGFLVRRARFAFSGDVHDRVSFFIQPDFASEVGGAGNVGQLRDAYFDLYLDRTKEFRLRVGQSIVPFGWENMQSSANRLPLDRSDPINSALPNERDVGVFAYWTPRATRARFRILSDSGLKGTGDFGLIGVGVFNGQLVNRAEANENLHTALRVSYPFRLSNGQFIEVGLQGYTGRFVVPVSQRTAGVTGAFDFKDERAAASLVVYPQPFGLQAEWNVGSGPEIDPASRAIGVRRLDGGYVQAMYRARLAGGTLIPFARAQRYDGGKKGETDARSYRVRELELGSEWQPVSGFEFTAMYTMSDRRYEDAAKPNNRQRGQLLRLQAQVNY